jgi:hypothetical protein
MDNRGPLLLWLYSISPGLAALWAMAAARPFQPKTALLKWPGFPKLALGYLLFPALAIVAAALSVLFNLVDWDWHRINFAYNFLLRLRATSPELGPVLPSNGQLLRTLLIYSPLLMVVPSIMESLAWQGFWYRLMNRHGFWAIALSSGLLWWLWQMPVLLKGYPYGQQPLFSLGMGLLYGLGHQSLLTWLRRVSQNLWPVILARATLGGAALLPIVFSSPFDPLWAHLRGLTGILLMTGLLGAMAGFKLIPLKDSSR